MEKYFYDTEFTEKPNTIELISIAIVRETDNASIYCINQDYNQTQCNEWVKTNVLPQLPPKTDPAWMPQTQIPKTILKFLKPTKQNPIELWGYYSAYDHVALCWLFGSMIDLPPGMPMYTKDIKQLADSLGNPQLPPQTTNKHNALQDAHWNKKAWQYLTKKTNKPLKNTLPKQSQ